MFVRTAVTLFTLLLIAVACTSEPEPEPQPIGGYEGGLVAGTIPDVPGGYTPGLYRTEGPIWDEEPCTFARLSFDVPREVIQESVTVGPATVEILPTDYVFESSGCHDWHPVGN